MQTLLLLCLAVVLLANAERSLEFIGSLLLLPLALGQAVALGACWLLVKAAEATAKAVRLGVRWLATDTRGVPRYAQTEGK